ILKQKMSKEGILQELKRRRFYEKPSVKRKRKTREARKRLRREMKRRGGPAAPRRAVSTAIWRNLAPSGGTLAGVSDPNRSEGVGPVAAAHVDDVAALIASEVAAAAAGTEQRGDEVVFWVATDAAAGALAEVRDAAQRWQAGGLAVDPARIRLAAAMPEAEWRDAWKRYFRV